MNKNSLLYWYPKIEDLDIPQPKTENILLTDKELEIAHGGCCPNSLTSRVDDCIKEHFKFPVFIRTDQASGKHSWKKSCYYDGSTELWKNLLNVIEFNTCADLLGLPFKAICVREFILMDTRFTAFYGEMPVNPERRYFIKNGDVQCHHPYWIKEAIESSWQKPSVENWRELANELNAETDDEISLLTDYSQKVAWQFKGYWSVDFCKAKDGRWILIDMALGDESWHPKDCPKMNQG